MAELKLYPWSPNWYVRYRDEEGKYRKVSTRTDDKAKAKQELAKILATRELPPEQFTVDFMIDAYLEDRKGQVVSYGSLEYPTKFLKEYFGHMQPQHITEAVVKGYWQKLRDMGRSDGTVIKHLGILRSAAAFVERKNWITKAPYIPFPPKPQPKQRWLTHTEADKLIKAATEPHLYLFIMLALKTGARKAAILQLTWDRVDFDKGIIDYGESVGKKRRAIVPISKALRQDLLYFKDKKNTNYVIEFRKKPVRDVKKAFQSTLKASGIDHCTIHDLRRTCATWLVQKGIPTREIARMLGDSEEMINKVYGHHSPDYLKKAAEALDW